MRVNQKILRLLLFRRVLRVTRNRDGRHSQDLGSY
jgi:hypothetical protein